MKGLRDNILGIRSIALEFGSDDGPDLPTDVGDGSMRTPRQGSRWFPRCTGHRGSSPYESCDKFMEKLHEGLCIDSIVFVLTTRTTNDSRSFVDHF